MTAKPVHYQSWKDYRVRRPSRMLACIRAGLDHLQYMEVVKLTNNGYSLDDAIKHEVNKK
jgi:hypothetical protein